MPVLPSVVLNMFSDGAGSYRSAVPTVNVLLNGQSVTSSIGALTLSTGFSKSIIGLAVTTATNSLSVSVSTSISLTGIAITSSQGSISITVDDSTQLTPLAVTSAPGTISITATRFPSVSLTGQSISSSQGSLFSQASGITDGISFSFISTTSSTAPNQEFLGGASGPIVSGTTGTTFLRTNWARLYANLSDWKFSTTRTLSRSKSLLYDGAAQEGQIDSCRGTYQFDTGAAGFSEIFISVNYYWEVNPSYAGIQWKMLRWQTRLDHDGSGGPEVVDGYPPSAYLTNSTAQDETPWSNFTALSGYTSVSNSPTNQTVQYNNSSQASPKNTWFNGNFFFKDNSSLGAADGVQIYKARNANTGSTYFTQSSSNRITRSTFDITNVFRYQLFQNYMGNGPVTPSGNSFGDGKIYMDDIYISWVTSGTGARRRVELGNASTPGTSTKRVIQPFSKSGTNITITTNIGHITETTGLYLFEYDATDTLITTIGPLAKV